MSKLETISLKGNQYATVPTRLKEFREKNPRSSVVTEPTITDTRVIFKATIITDLADETSARSTGHAYGELKDDKAFEKLETVATGRALALLGYLNNGQVATTEEMEEFELFQENKFAEAVESVAKATTREEMQSIIAKLKPAQQKELLPHIQERSKELSNASK